MHSFIILVQAGRPEEMLCKMLFSEEDKSWYCPTLARVTNIAYLGDKMVSKIRVFTTKSDGEKLYVDRYLHCVVLH